MLLPADYHVSIIKRKLWLPLGVQFNDIIYF